MTLEAIWKDLHTVETKPSPAAKAMLRYGTPIEKYRVKNKAVYVKREDLAGISPAPPLGKIRGLVEVVSRLHSEGYKLIGCWDTNVSKLGLGLAVAATKFTKLKAIVGYPDTKALPEYLKTAQSLGATLYSTRPNYPLVCFSVAKAHVERKGGAMLPFGLECKESVMCVAEEASRTPKALLKGTVVLCCGSGVTLSGLLNGFPVLPTRIIGLSSGRSLQKIRRCLLHYVPKLPECLELREAKIKYAETVSADCPFPTHPNYDLKAWDLLVREIDDLKAPILFWNIGS